MTMRNLICCAIVAILAAPSAIGDKNTLLDRIRKQTAVLSDIDEQSLSISAIDRRLGIKDCETGLVVSFPFPKNQETIQAQCDAPKFKVFLSVRYEQAAESKKNPRAEAKDSFWTVEHEIKKGQKFGFEKIIFKNAPIDLSIMETHPLRSHINNPTLELVASQDLSPDIPININHINCSIEIPKLKSDIASGVIITRPMIKMVRANTNQIPKNAVTSLSEILGRQTVRTLRNNQIVTATAVREAYLVTKGQPVTLVVRMPNLEIAVSAMAIENGGLGQTVRVLNADSGKEVFAEVLGKNLVGLSKRLKNQ